MLPDFHVVPDLDEIIDLGPLAYHGFAQGRAVNGRAGADLHVVLDSDNPDLRNLVVSSVVQGEAVTV